MFRRRRNHHLQPVFGLSGFLDADAYFVSEVLLRFGLIRLAVVGSNTGSCPDELTYEWFRYGVLAHLAREFNDVYPELGGPCLKILASLLTGRCRCLRYCKLPTANCRLI